ncbi:MAG: hypothetical protein Ct9H300mP29_8350 [Candidatus Neomarinimicrobiota bacterium]|nr:MAG: hypothetical protein Ct9H300mP29_8350 [Candidatus Neomarinimicrobiota bacterium]
MVANIPVKLLINFTEFVKRYKAKGLGWMKVRKANLMEEFKVFQ